jgi:hypothetical protein
MVIVLAATVEIAEPAVSYTTWLNVKVDVAETSAPLLVVALPPTVVEGAPVTVEIANPASSYTT